MSWKQYAIYAAVLLAAGLTMLGLLIVLAPQNWVIGICGNSDMACHRTTHAVLLWGSLLSIQGLSLAVRSGETKTLPSDPWETPKAAAPTLNHKNRACCD